MSKMGYYTTYLCLNSIEEITQIQSKIAELIEQGQPSEFCYGLFNEESCKWYDHDHDLTFLSKSLNSLILKIEGHGEEEGDDWNEVWLNGHYIREYYQAPDLDQMIDQLTNENL